MTKTKFDYLIEKLVLAKKEQSLANAKVNSIVHDLKVSGFNKEEIKREINRLNKKY